MLIEIVPHETISKKLSLKKVALKQIQLQKKKTQKNKKHKQNTTNKTKLIHMISHRTCFD